MSLFDSIASSVTGALGGASGNAPGGLLDAIGQLVTNPETGGLAGLVKTFEEKGLAQTVGSWISTGQNLPISPEQIQSVLGNAQVQAMARQVGVPESVLSGHLAEMLPDVIDRLTPHGALPDGGAVAKGLELLKTLARQS